jgi:hypothetical protein
MPNHARLCENSRTRKNFAPGWLMTRFDEVPGRIQCSKNEFLHSLSLQATRDSVSSSTFTENVISPACLRSGRSAKES